MMRHTWIVLGAIALIGITSVSASALEEVQRLRVTDGSASSTSGECRLFGDAETYPTGEYPMSVAVGDFDDDGLQDLAVANRFSSDVSVLPGIGNGRFVEEVRYGLWGEDPLAPQAIAVGDFNGDGRADLVTANAYSQDVQLLRGRPSGRMELYARYEVGFGPYSVAVGEFNHDGVQDLAVADVSGQIAVLLGVGNGAFEAARYFDAGGDPPSINPRSGGVTPVAILGAVDFDVVDVDVTTLAFGPDGAPIAHVRGHLEDVNHDGIMDLMLHFRTRDTGIACGDESATLTGEMLVGRTIEGTDSIQTVGCRETRRPAIRTTDQDMPATSQSDGLANVGKRF